MCSGFADVEVVLCMQYRTGQLYMIAKHSREQSGGGEGVAVVKNEPCVHEEYGHGQFTEKHIYLSRYSTRLTFVTPYILVKRFYCFPTITVL